MFKLSDKFLAQYEGQQPEWGFGDLSYFVYKRTYARTLEDGTQEEFWQTCQRVVEGVFNIQLNHCRQMGLQWDARRSQRSAQRMFQKMWEMKFLPPGRGLWLMGTPIVDKIGSAGLNNCGFISTKEINKDFSMPFAWAADMLMLGVGIGFDTKGAGLVTISKPLDEEETFVIPDTREGWVEAVKVLLDSYAAPERKRVAFDYSEIRKAGEPIKGFGGIASGSAPLKEGLESIATMLDALDGKPIDSVTITDIFNFIGKFVVSGNVRRSAEIAIGEGDDQSFIEMKDPEKHQAELYDRRWASNNSIFVTPESDFGEAVKRIVKNGEPGLIFLENAKHYGRLKDGWKDEHSSKYDDVDGFNPCAEQSLKHGELCCLVETFPANHESAEEYYETLKFAFLYAKSVTLLPTHNPLTNQIMLTNRRIGLSMSGIQQAIKKFGFSCFFEEFCDLGYERVRHWDKTYSRWLGIPTSIKVTTVKPSGTVSLLAGATPGVHCTHSEFYWRTFRVSALSGLVAKLVAAGYRVEFSAMDRERLKKTGWDIEKNGEVLTKELFSSENAKYREFAEAGGSMVVYFPVKEKNFTKSKFDISLWEQLMLTRELQNCWSDNSVSVTVTFKEEEARDLRSAIEYVAPYVKTLSFLPLQDHKYEQAPYQECTEEEYDAYSKGLKPLKLGKTKSGEEAKGEKYCSNDSCEI